jgi:hypothetical protein
MSNEESFVGLLSVNTHAVLIGEDGNGGPKRGH